MKYIYYYIEKDLLNDVLENGIDITKNFDTKLELDNIEQNAITCYLNPKDSYKYTDNKYEIIKIETSKTLQIKIVDDILFEESLVSIDDYKKGSYEFPIAIITKNIDKKFIYKYNKNLDYPIDYNTSDELYYNVSLTDILDKYKMSSKTTLWAILDFLSNEGYMDMIEYEDSYVYIDKKTQKKYTISID